jgi:hypothetical protein
MLARKRKYSTEWQRRDVVERWKASGLSQAEFCRKENIPEWALSAWKRLEYRRPTVSGEGRYGPPPRAGRQLVSYWRRVVQEHGESGLSGAEFCRRHGMKVVTFYKWQGRFARKQRSEVQSVPKENPFVAVTVPTKPAEPVPDSAVEIVLAGGSIVRVTEHTPLALLAKVLRALEATC